MKQHPVPQQITSFQFKLIGDMTVRQFVYLASGVLLGYLTINLGLTTVIKIPLGIVLALTGFAFAFMPIEERPLDRWIISFIKAVYRPTIFLWQKKPVLPEFLRPDFMAAQKLLPLAIETTPVDQQELWQLIKSQKKTADPFSRQEETFLNKISQLFQQVSLPGLVVKTLPPPPAKPAAPKPRGPQIEEQKRQEALLKKETKKQESISKLLEPAETIVKPREKRLVFKTVVTAPKQTAPATGTKPTVRIIPAEKYQKKMPSIMNPPNIVHGVVKTSRGDTLPNIILVVKDKKGDTVRALKTNKLGRFVTATPLPADTYTIELEDPAEKFKFDIIEVTLTDKEIKPIEIKAHDEREEIRQALSEKLFGKKI